MPDPLRMLPLAEWISSAGFSALHCVWSVGYKLFHVMLQNPIE